MMPDDNNRLSTICAPATAQGGAIAVIRLSGPNAITIADSIFRPVTGSQLSARKGYTIARGYITDNDGNTVDDVLASIFRAPHSYTGEDCIELSCHASPYIVQRLLEMLCSAGCRLAEPGEFTRRAFINGKMDLSQAEAVADLIAATSAAEHRTAMNQMRGTFSNKLAALREQLLQLTSLMELELDFSDHEDLEFADRSELKKISDDIESVVAGLARSFRVGNAIRRGVAVAIVGETNVGKSTLLNALVGDDRAIVSDIHGTTRDAIEDCTVIGGVRFRFIDTAGIRHTDDIIESLGIERSYKAIGKADIVILLLDLARLDLGKGVDSAVLLEHVPTSISKQLEDKKVVVVLNKCDLVPSVMEPDNSHEQTSCPILISAKHGNNIEALRRHLVSLAAIPEVAPGDVVVTNARHYQALLKALADIHSVQTALSENQPTDLVCEDLRLCLHHLAEITGGEITSQETLNNIFAHFCVGK